MMTCKLFNCDKRRGNYCCAFCGDREKCKNPCKNSPAKCGYHIENRANDEIDLSFQLPKEMYEQSQENGKTVTYCTLRQKVLHMIGLDGDGKPYKRHGKSFYKPYRNYFITYKSDKDFEKFVQMGYMNVDVDGRGYCCYSLTSNGFYWLGKQIDVHIYDEKN